jgi:hypothetical protein
LIRIALNQLHDRYAVRGSQATPRTPTTGGLEPLRKLPLSKDKLKVEFSSRRMPGASHEEITIHQDAKLLQA